MVRSSGRGCRRQAEGGSTYCSHSRSHPCLSYRLVCGGRIISSFSCASRSALRHRPGHSIIAPAREIGLSTYLYIQIISRHHPSCEAKAQTWFTPSRALFVRTANACSSYVAFETGEDSLSKTRCRVASRSRLLLASSGSEALSYLACD